MAKQTQAMYMLQQLLPQLTEEEKDELRFHLGPVDPCRKTGHKFRPIGRCTIWSDTFPWIKTGNRFVCERCGHEIER